MRRTVPPSAEIQASIDKLMSRGLVDDPQKMPSELGRLGARLIIQRAVEEELDQWLGRARYERRPERQRGLRNGSRPRHVQTAEGELRIEIPKSEQDRVRFNYGSALTDATSVKDAKLRLQVLISELEHVGYVSAARCLSDDLDALVVHLRYPVRHRERWRSTNLLERSLGEVRRRTKVMGRFPGETSCLSLVWAVLDLFFSHASNGATLTDVDRQHLYRIKYQQADPDTLDEEVTAA